MSEYTYVNVFTENPEMARSYLSINGYMTERDEYVFIRCGGDEREKVRSEILDEYGSFVMDYPVEITGVNRRDVIATVFLDRMEDTGGSHQTELYKVYAFEGVDKIDKKYIPDDDPDATQTEEYYLDRHNLNVKASF